MKEPEIVYTIYRYYDAPRVGVADFQGVPSFFQCLFDEDADDWTNLYCLSPVPEAVLPLTEQERKEWYWWWHDYGQGKAEVEKYPDRAAHYSSLRDSLHRSFNIDEGTAIKAVGRFESFQTQDALPGTARLWRVRWSDPIPADAGAEAA